MTNQDDYRFDFLPDGFSEKAWANRPFKSTILDVESLIYILTNYEKKLGFGKYLSGIIYYKEGHFSEYYDGTYNKKPRPYSRWWETEVTKCHKGCCTVPPDNWDPVTRTYSVNDSEKGDYDENFEWKWCICQKEAKPNGPFMSDICAGHPCSEPVPLKSYWIIPKPVKQTWQEFRRIGGPGGLADQISQIKDLKTVLKIRLDKLGAFTVNISMH